MMSLSFAYMINGLQDDDTTVHVCTTVDGYRHHYC